MLRNEATRHWLEMRNAYSAANICVSVFSAQALTLRRRQTQHSFSSENGATSEPQITQLPLAGGAGSSDVWSALRRAVAVTLVDFFIQFCLIVCQSLQEMALLFPGVLRHSEACETTAANTGSHFANCISVLSPYQIAIVLTTLRVGRPKDKPYQSRHMPHCLRERGKQ